MLKPFQIGILAVFCVFDRPLDSRAISLENSFFLSGIAIFLPSSGDFTFLVYSMGEKGNKRSQPSEDYVVKELDVFVCNNLAPKLHVFQFPPGFEPLSNEKSGLLGVKVKMESKRFMMDVKIDTRSRNFDRGKSEQIAFHSNNGDEPYFPSKYMNKMMLKSFESKPSNLQYAVGLVKQGTNELHLTPINSVIQFRPSFDYFDRKEKKTPAPNSSGPGTSKQDESSAVEDKKEEEYKKILMRFERPDEERIKKAREASFTFMRQKMANEPWSDVTVNLRDSGIAMIERQNLLCQHNNEEYLNGFENPDVLMVGDEETTGNTNANHDSPIEEYLKLYTLNDPSSCISSSLSRFKSIPIGNKIQSIMMNAKVASFRHLKELISDASDDLTLIRGLQQYALVVRGNWVVKSEVLHSKENNASSTSPLTGIPLELLCRARDYILWSFTQQPSLNRKELVEKTKIPGEEVFNILKEMSILNSTTKLWDFAFPQDNDFIEKYPEVVQRQKLLWEARIIQLEKPYSTPKIVKAKRTRKTTTITCS